MKLNRRMLATILLVPFAVLTIFTIATVGYVEIFNYQRHSPAGWQVFADLCVALILVLSWLVPDAQKAGRNPWGWVVATLFTGSIAPLTYLALYGRRVEIKKQ